MENDGHSECSLSEADLKPPGIQNAFDFVFVFTQANINGRVLAQCSVDELKKEMNMNFGDWHLFRSMVRFYSIIRALYYIM